MPAEALLCMGAPIPHRWRPSARPLPAPVTHAARRATVATARNNIQFGGNLYAIEHLFDLQRKPF